MNCTGSCSWKIYVKGGIVTWETQQTDYPRTRPDMPNHEPRGCSRGASYSWYLYCGNRVKYPLVRARLLKLWREARKTLAPVEAWEVDRRRPGEARDATSRSAAWAASSARPGTRSTRSSPPPTSIRQDIWARPGGRVLADPCHVDGLLRCGRALPFADRRRLHVASTTGTATCRRLSPQTWGEQTDVPESADWYNSGFLILWGSNVPQTRTPDAHFYTEVRYKGTKSVVICPDYARRPSSPTCGCIRKQGTDAALAMAMGHVILQGVLRRPAGAVFQGLCRSYTDMPMLVRLVKQDGDATCPSACCALPTSTRSSVKTTIRNGRRSPLTRLPAGWSCRTARSASAGARRASGTSRRRRAGGSDDAAAVAG